MTSSRTTPSACTLSTSSSANWAIAPQLTSAKPPRWVWPCSTLLSDNRDGNLNPEQIKFAQTIYSAGNDLLTLINDILDLSKIEAGKLDVRPESITIARLVDDLSNTFAPIAAQKQIELAMTIEADVP